MKGKQQDFRTEKYIRYGIRKYSFGAASVAIAAGLMFLGNGAVLATEQNPVSDSKENIQKVENSSPELGESNIQLSDKTIETPKKEVVKVNKSLLETSISNLEAALSNAKYADASVVANVREALATAKAVLANEAAKQEEVNVQKEILSALGTVVTESNKLGLEKEQADKDKVAKEEAERNATPTEKALSEAKSELDKVSSEADVTNTLAVTELRKKEVAEENRAAIEAAVAKNQSVIDESKILLADKSVTKEQVDAQLARLNESILAVYSELKKAGIGRDGKFAVDLAAQDFYAEGSTSTIHTSEINATIHTGSDTYTIPHQEITLTKGAGTDTSGLEVVVYSNQRDGDETNAGNGMHTEQGGTRGHNNTGRVDYPLTPEAAKKLAEEAPLWRNKLRADGSRISNAATAIYSANGGYEYLATEIYGYAYEQGVDRVYIKGLKERIAVTEAAKQAGWSLTSVTPTNLVPGLAYDEATDTIQGVVSANIENGVYDLRFDVTATHTDGRSVTFRLQNLRAGWVGWQDTIPPTIESDSARYERTVGDDANINIRFYDDAGSSAIPKGTAGNYNYTTAEGKVITVRKQNSPAVTGVSGYNTTGATLDDSKVLIPGTNYSLSNSSSTEQTNGRTNKGNAIIGGKVTEAGIYTVSVYAKDYDKLSSNTTWNQSGQETHASLTVVVKPKVEVQNVETYSTTVPVKISKGATSAKVTMPDGTVTNLKAVDGKWLVDSGSTNTAVTENQELGAVDSNTVFNIPVTSEATAKVGVDNITVEASSENVKGTFLREQVELTGTDGQKHIAKLNSTSGHWELPADYAEVKTPNGDGTTTWTKREVYTEAQQNGAMKFYIYEYTRQLDINGKVTSVDTPTRPLTVYASQNTSQAGDGMSVTITYDKHSNAWSSSDGTEVTATKLGDNSWEVLTKSGFGGIIRGTIATNSDVATVVNTKPTASSQDYTSTKGTAVDLRNEAKAAVTISDAEDTKYGKTTYITRITVTSPSGVQKVYDTKQDANNYNLASGYTLNEVGVYTVTVDVIDSNGNYTTDATIGGTESGVDHGAGSSTATTTYRITVTDTIEGHNVTSSDIQGAAQTGTPTFTSVGDGSTISPSATSPAKLVATDGSLVETLTVANEGTYTINPETGVVTFKPLPTFTGKASPVTVKLTAILGTDANNANITATATATYTPTVVPVKPTAVASQTTGPQGKAQNSAIKFDAADTDDTTVNFAKGTVAIDANTTKSIDLNTASVTLLNEDGVAVTSVTVANEGTYTLDTATNVITFQPVVTFTGTVTKPVSVRVADTNGTTVTTTYTPTVTDVTMTAENATSTDVQGKTQTGTPEFETSDPSVTIAKRQLLDPTTLQPTTSVTIANEGTYTIDPTTGVVTFVPVPTFTGEGTGVTVQATDSNGETATATYKPTVTPITITGENVTSKNIQGESQSEKPLFSSSDESAPVSNYKLVDPTTGNPTTATSVAVENIGTYTIDSTTGKVTFKPVATYTGTPASVTVQASATITNEKGESTEITGTAAYTPTVVPVVPTAKESATAGKQGQTQTSQIIFDTSGTDATTLNFAKGETSEVLGEDGQPKSVALDKSTLTLLDANGNAVTTVTVDGEGTYTLDKTTNVITFQPTEEFTGKATPVRVQIADINGTTVTTTYTPTVVAEDGTVIVEYKDEEGNVISPSTTPVNNEKVTTPFTTEPKEIPGYTLVKVETTNGQVDEGTKKVSGKVTNDTTTVTYTYRKNVQTATISYYDVTTGAEVAIDSAKVPAAAVETVEGVYNGAIDFVNREKAIAALEKAGYTLVEDGFIVATTADKLFDNDTAVNQNFTVTVKQRVEPVTPNDEKPVPGQPVDPENPNSPVWPSTAENLDLTKTVTRTIKYRYNDENGKEVTADKVQTVTFTRSASVNLVTGNVEYTDWSASQTLEAVVSPEVANYTYDKKTVTSLEVTNESTDSTVYVIYTPVAPTTTPATSTDIQGKTQTGTPTYKHADGTELKPTTDNPAKFVGTEETTIPATKDGKTVGTYTIDPTGTVTFTPNKDFVGTPDSAKVVVTDPTNGTTVESSYTPTVTPVTPTGVDTSSTGPKNTPQSGTPTFVPGHKDVPMDNTVPATFEDGTTSKTVPNEGTYTVDATGKVTFTPNKDFVGTATGVAIVRKDTNGTVAKAKYIPTVYEVKSDTQVATVTYKDTNGTILGEVDILQGDSGSEMNYSTAERINALKKLGYELVSDEFTKADGSKQSFDNDTNAVQKFVVTVQPRLVPVIPSDVTPVPGQPIDPEDPNSPVWPESVKELTTSEEVTRTITYVDGDGKEVTTSVTSSVKFTRDAKVNLVTGEVTYGEWKEATTDVLSGNKLPLVKGYIAVSGDIEASTKDQTVKAEDKDIIQKVVYKKLGAWIPNVPGQTNPPRIDYPNDPNGDPTKPGVPTEDIVIPYVTDYIPRDKDGNPLKPVDPEDPTKGYVPPTLPTDPSQDTPINYTKITTSYVTVDPNGKEISIPDYPREDGEQPKKDIPGYRFVETKKLPNGDVEHVYEKVNTFFKDKEGNEIPNYPSEPGTVDKKDIPEYRFVETKKLPNGDTEHVYEKVNTFFKDKEGNEIPNYPSEPGTVDKKDIPEYRFVETNKLPNGDVEHVYEKVTTFFKDKDGNEIKEKESGSVDKKDIPEYRFVETKKLPNGDTEHVYEKVNTFFKDKEGNEIPKYPSEPGTVDKKDIPEYRFVETKKLPNGDTEHVYEKVTTFFKDKDGNEIKEKESGSVDKKDIPEYRFVETKKLPNGDIEHVYEKVTPPAPTPSPVPQPNPGKQNTTTWTDENGNPLKPTEPGSKEPGTIPGYEYVKTVTDSNGNIRHIFRKVEMPTPTPVEPKQPAYVEGQKELPNTGTEAHAGLAALGLLGALSGFGLVARKKKED
ncbi:mucin-binding protein [Streptococcus mitis]|uniref:mucin-binding protein n=2 Tax=Streptococcus TaxID=1301 RepID=UPI0039C4C458